MAFGEFTFPDVTDQLGLASAEVELFPGAPELAPEPWFAEHLRGEVTLGLAINTEKARSEFIIAPVLSAVRRAAGGKFALFSGVKFNVDPERKLDGFCDFLFSRTPFQLILRAPVVAVVEAKNDSIASGLGQCIATMVAAREFNARAPSDPPVRAVYGVVTTGSSWKFLRLIESDLAIDPGEVFVSELGRIMGNLAFALRGE